LSPLQVKPFAEPMELADGGPADRWPTVQPTPSTDGLDEGARLLLYWQIIKSHRNFLALSVLCATLLTLAVTSCIETPRYRAIAVLRPADPQAAISRLAGMTGAVSLLSAPLQQQRVSARAEEFASILTSYSFISQLISQYNLTSDLEDRPPRIWPFHTDRSPWNLYRVMLGRFSSRYDSATGNLVLNFIDRSPQRARVILQLYIQNLRTRLRGAEMRNARLAANALRRQARSASDALLQQRLYGLVAAQIERGDLADVDADFAFTVIQPPVVPDTPYEPRILLDCILAALVSAFLSTLLIVAVDSRRTE